MITEDITAFLNPSDFAVTVTVAGAEVAVLFDNGYQAALNGFAESSAPYIMGKTSELASLVQGSAVTVESVAYKVTQVHPDGTGMSTLILEKA